MLTVIIPEKVPGTNKVYRSLILPTKGKRTGNLYKDFIVKRVLTGEARAFRSRLLNYMKGSIKPNTPLSVEIEIYGNFYTKAGKIRRRDIDIKFLIDSIFEPFKVNGVDDSQIFRYLNISKHNSDSEQTLIRITPIEIQQNSYPG